MRLGLFTFKNDEVLLLAGDKSTFLKLASAIEGALKTRATLAIHETAEVSNKHPAKLFAVARPDRPLSANEFYWPCSSVTVEQLRALGDSSSEVYLELSSSSLFMVSCGESYGPEWWQRYA
jgi:hypothetical protein